MTLVLIYVQPRIVNWLPDLMYSSSQNEKPAARDPNDRESMDPSFLMGGSEEAKPDAAPPADEKPAETKPEASGAMDPSFLTGGSGSGEKKTE